MKHIRSLFQRLLAGAAASVLLTAAVQADEGRAVVRAVRGTAQYKSTAGAQWAPLKVGLILRSGAIVQTASAAQVDLFLGANGPVVRIVESTEMGLDKLSIQKTGDDTVIETQLDLKAGTLLGNVKKLAAASRYDVKTPNGVAGIRGTQYKASANGVVTCIEGTVRVTYVNPLTNVRIEVDVKEGQTFVPPTGGQPHQILNDPQLVEQARQEMPPNIPPGTTTTTTITDGSTITVSTVTPSDSGTPPPQRND
jgi:hypothetical protein